MGDIDHSFIGRLDDWLRSHPQDEAVPDQAEPSSGSWLPLGNGDTGRMLRAQEAWSTALDLWRDEGDAFTFLTHKHAMLEGRAPIIVAAESPTGLKAVRSIIERLRYGSAA